MKVELKLSGVDGVLDMLKSLPPEVVSKRGGPVKSGLRKGALVILKAARANLLASTMSQGKSQSESTGLLLKSLIASRGKAPSSGKGERYLVRVKKRIYARKGGKPVSTLKTGQLLEYGSGQQPAEPWLRPAFQAKAAEAIRTIETETLKAIEPIAKKLAKGR